jgi:predicted permease
VPRCDSPVGADYFRAMRIPLVAGRTISDRDIADAPPVVVVSEAFAQRTFPGVSAVGQRIRFYSGRPGVAPPPPREIVGVVGDVRQLGIAEAPVPQMYVPHAQIPWGFGSFVVRVSAGRDPMSIVSAAKAAIAQVDPEQAPYDFRALTELVASNTARHRTFSALLVGMAIVALLLAAVGIYGVISTSVRARTQEIAVRVALGAAASDVLRMIVFNGMRLALVGSVVGLAGALALTHWMGTLLFDVEPGDPVAFAGGTFVLLLVAMAACAWPARRALRLNPAMALRAE